MPPSARISLADREAVFTGEHDIQQNEIEVPLTIDIEHVQAVGGVHDLVPFGLEIHLEAVSEMLIILDEQNCFHISIRV